MLDSLELGPVAGVRVNSGLSGGQLRRLSIGVEYWRDLAADLTQALDAARG